MGTLRFVGRVVRGLIAAAVLAALVAGLPWALWHYIGWPLPSHVPTWAEIHDVLLGPMTTTFLLDFLACAIWIVWTAFTLDVLRCTFEIARDLARGGFDTSRLPDFSAAGPIHALAGVLVGAVLLSVLGNRPAPAPATSLSAALGGGAQVVATASAWQHPAPATDVIVRDAVFATPTSAAGATAVTAPTHPVSVVVLAPSNGVHDSLWRIAQRTLGDGARWPEIFDLNKGKPQPGGRSLTQPSLIFPGEEFTLPADATTPAQPAPPPQNPPVSVPTSPAPTTTPPTSTPPPTTTAPPTSVQPSTTAQQPAATGTNSRPTVTTEPSFTWGPDLFVGLGLAAAVSAALLVARRRYRAQYRPGSGDRDDLPVAPVVYQLRLAHLRAESDDEIDLDDVDGEAEDDVRPRRVPPPPALVVGSPTAGTSERRGVLAPGLGVRDGREIALDLAVARGLGVVGGGTPAAIRALLVAVLTAATGHGPMSAAASVVIPAEDLTAVLGRAAAQAHLPSGLRVVADLDEALDVLEAETLVRAAARGGQRSWPPLVLVARPPQQHQRLQAVLDNGSPFGVTGLLLGQWQPGVSCYVREDGTISATGPGLGEALRGTRMFRLGEDDTATLLTLLRQTELEPPAEDDAVIPPTTRPRIVPVRNADDHLAGNLAPDDAVGLGLDQADRGGEVSAAEPASDVELEVTAATPAPADDELEILAPNRPAAPGARLRPPAAVRPRPAASGEPEPSEVADTPAAHRAPRSTPVAAPAPVNDIAEEGAKTARALITISVLGSLRVRWQPDGDNEREITGALQPRTKELLVLLALHPGGTTRDTLVSALWGEDPPSRPTNALHTALSRLRRDLIEATNGAVTDIASADNGHYRLDPATVDVDYWRFEHAVAARRAAATDAERIAAYRDVVDSYGGPLVEGLSKVEWLEPAREAIRRDAIDAVSGLARALVEHDPQQTLDLLEVARAFDPHNELLYRDIMRLQERLGQLDAIPRTLTLLTTRLAEVNEQPTPQARGLAARLGGRHDHDPAGPGQPSARGERGRSAAS